MSSQHAHQNAGNLLRQGSSAQVNPMSQNRGGARGADGYGGGSSSSSSSGNNASFTSFAAGSGPSKNTAGFGKGKKAKGGMNGQGSTPQVVTVDRILVLPNDPDQVNIQGHVKNKAQSEDEQMLEPQQRSIDMRTVNTSGEPPGLLLGFPLIDQLRSIVQSVAGNALWFPHFDEHHFVIAVTTTGQTQSLNITGRNATFTSNNPPRSSAQLMSLIGIIMCFLYIIVDIS